MASVADPLVSTVTSLMVCSASSAASSSAAVASCSIGAVSCVRHVSVNVPSSAVQTSRCCSSTPGSTAPGAPMITLVPSMLSAKPKWSLAPVSAARSFWYCVHASAFDR